MKKLKTKPNTKKPEAAKNTENIKKYNRIPWKAKIAMALMAVTLVYIVVMTGLAMINNFFEHNRLVFKSPVVVTFNAPIAVETRDKWLSPIASQSAEPVVEQATESAELVPQVEAAEPEPLVLRGEASYYSEDGCLGCSETLTMANGERLDDTKYTVALTPETVSEYKLLNDMVKIYNPSTDRTVVAKVTDTGGFGKYNRVADLSLATKEALSCADICEVEITLSK